MSQAVVGFLGTLVGAIVALTGTVLLDVRRHRTEANRRSEDERRELQVAARLVLEEIDRAELLLVRALHRGTFAWSSRTELLSTAAYSQHAQILARYTSSELWGWICSAYHAIRELNDMAVTAESEQALINAPAFVEASMSERDIDRAAGEFCTWLGEAMTMLVSVYDISSPGLDRELSTSAVTEAVDPDF